MAGERQPRLANIAAGLFALSYVARHGIYHTWFYRILSDYSSARIDIVRMEGIVTGEMPADRLPHCGIGIHSDGRICTFYLTVEQRLRISGSLSEEHDDRSQRR